MSEHDKLLAAIANVKDDIRRARDEHTFIVFCVAVANLAFFLALGALLLVR